jgi:hypothetical protein
MISPKLELNSFEVLLVQDRLQKQGVKHYEMRPGNNCIWVSYGLINEYYIFRDGKIVDIQTD